MKLWVDPPAGWKYGFPKVWNSETHPKFDEWIVWAGYPEDVMKSFGVHFYVRQWEYKEENVNE